jgi:glycosyltransferase involved in cell wall biosynthesis
MLEMAPWYVWLAGGIALLQLFKMLWFDLGLALSKPLAFAADLPPLSVIIAARNEEENLMEFLPAILEQDYPEFEVIVVDDASADGTEGVVRAYQKSHPHLRLRHIEDQDIFRGRKKFALTLGIKMAEYEHLVFTDADCRPASTNWLKTYAAAFAAQKLVLGFGGYQATPSFSWLNFFIRTDTLLIGIQYLGAARAGLPYMGVGRNMGYHRKLFFDAKGFYHHMQMPSGDDDLLVNAYGKRVGCAVLLQPESVTLSAPKSSWNEWSKQKQRHVSTFRHYRGWSKLLLIGIKGLFWAFWAGIAALLFTPFWFWAMAFAALFLGLRMAVLRPVARKLGEPRLWAALPLAELVLEIIYLYLMRQRILDLLNPWKKA